MRYTAEHQWFVGLKAESPLRSVTGKASACLQRPAAGHKASLGNVPKDGAKPSLPPSSMGFSMGQGFCHGKGPSWGGAGGSEPQEGKLPTLLAPRPSFPSSTSIPAHPGLLQQSATSRALQTSGTGKTGSRAIANVLLYPWMSP